MERIINFSLKHPVTIIISTLVTLFFGLYGLSQMGVENMPNIDIPVVMVRTTMQGASPAIMDNDVTDKLESSTNTVEGVKNLLSSSSEGSSFIMVEFELSRNIGEAAADVRGKVNTAQGRLPDGANTPMVDKFNISDMPVMYIAVEANGVAPQVLSDYVENVAKERLQTVSGVGGIEAVGLAIRQVRVWLDVDSLAARGLTAQDVASAIARNHVELPGGQIQTGTQDFGIRLKGEYDTIEALSNLPVKSSEGAVVRLRDVARVEDGFADTESSASLNGKPSILMTVRKQSGTNEVALSDNIQKRIEELNANSPDGIALKIVQDNARFIRMSMKGVKSNIMAGIMLTGLMMFIFLRTIKSTMVTIITIPVCLLGGLLCLWGMGFTINNMTTMGLSLVIGMVVDATTVVLENVHRHFDQGKTAWRAALDGTSEVANAVIAGAATTISVFLPVALMPGVIGRFFRSFGFSITITIAISLILSVTLTPFLCSRILTRHKPSRFMRTLEKPEQWLTNGYQQLLRLAVNHRWLTIAFGITSFAIGIFFATQLGSEFFPAEDRGEVSINYELNAAASLENNQAFLANLTKTVSQDPHVAYTYATVGAGMSSDVSKGQLNVVFVPRNERPSQTQIMSDLRKRLAIFKDVKITLGRGGSNEDFAVRLLGSSTEELSSLADKIIEDLKKTESKMVDFKTDIELNKPRVELNINRGIADDLGVNVNNLAREYMTLFGGRTVGTFNVGGHSRDIRLKAEASQRNSTGKLLGVLARTNTGELIRSDGLVFSQVTMAPNVIRRFNRQKSIQISANLDGISVGEGMEIFKKAFQRHVPADQLISMEAAGDAQDMQESFGYLFTGLVFAVILVYTVMAIQFESFLHPLTVMFSVPLMSSGAFGLLLLMGLKLSVMSFMGVIMLVGIVVNNAIILVDFINQMRSRGMDKVEAVLLSGPLRFRPIIMTAFSTIAGAMPVVLGLVEGSEIRQPISVATIGGLMTSTLLTLLIIPVAYLVVDDSSDWFKGKISRFNAWRRWRRATRHSSLSSQEVNSL